MLCQDGTSLDRQLHLVLCVCVCVCVCLRVCVCVCMFVCLLSAKMAHLLACFVKMAHLWTDSHILCCVCMRACEYVCMWLSAKKAHLLACFVKMAHLWTNSCTQPHTNILTHTHAHTTQDVAVCPKMCHLDKAR